MIDYTNLDSIREEMAKAAERARLALEGELAAEYRALRSLDPETIKDITSDTTDEVVYEKLIVVVQEASAKNESQAQLAGRIRELGNVAIEIAKQVPQLAAIL